MGAEGEPGHQRAEPGGHPAGEDRARAPTAHAHHLAVAELAAVGPVAQRVAAAHDPGVGRAHHERRRAAAAAPGAMSEPFTIRRRTAGRGRVRRRGRGSASTGGGDPARAAVAPYRVDWVAHRVDGAAADAALARADHQRGVVRSPAPSALTCWCSTCTPRSEGMESKPQECTIRAPVAAADVVEPVDALAARRAPRRTGRRSRCRPRRRPATRAIPYFAYGPTVVTTTCVDRASAVSDVRVVGVGDQERPRRRARQPSSAAPARASPRERPARPIRVPSGAWRARYSAVSLPTKPEAP